VVVRWFSLDTPVFSTNKTDRHDITEILLRVAVRFLGFEAGGGFSKFQFPLSINLTTITTYTGITDANGVNYLYH
jgi:hypothetical protein